MQDKIEKRIELKAPGFTRLARDQRISASSGSGFK